MERETAKRNRNMDVGDHVLNKFTKSKGEIVRIYHNRFLIRFFDEMNMSDERRVCWYNGEDVEIDIQWQRDKKIKELGI